MATTFANSSTYPNAPENANGTTRSRDDPFTSTPTMPSSRPQRYSSFDSRQFAENHSSLSPSHAKRALEAHLTETERRLQEASKLGTTLVEQRQKLSARLREVELQQNQNELAPELRQRLRDIEKEYNDVGRESARAFLGPKPDLGGTAAESETPFALDGRKPASPAKFSSQATDSPSKLNVPRKQRNQPSNQIHDIEFAAEISTSLLSQVRQLQMMLSEKDETLKATTLEKSRLEQEAEGFAQRLRSMDESEQRYKDENWNLESQLQELSAEHGEATSREHKTQQALTAATSEKNATLRELDDLKQTHGKFIEDHTLLRKNQDSELGSLRRDLNNGESERSSLQRKIEELTSQNQELAKAFAGRFRENSPERAAEVGSDPEMNPVDRSDTDHSPPPSPSKVGRRHSVLESETLKSSLHHAHRMIQNLKSNVHREKTEKLELKRMLQEARDELDVRRNEGPDHKRLKSKSNQDLAKKAVRPNMLGAGRNSRTDITVDEPGWEDHSTDNSPQPIRNRRAGRTDPSTTTDISDAYQTANETEDGFETAQERDYPTDNDTFSPVTESMAGNSSDEMTETEGGMARGDTIRGKRPSTLTSSRAEGRSSFSSTASTSADEGDSSFSTPNQAQPQKYRIKVNRGSRRSHLTNEGIDSSPLVAKGSPASFVGNAGQSNQSLFAELGDINGAESGEEETPSRGLISHRSTPSMRRPASSQRSSSKRRRSSISSQRSSQSIRSSAVLHNGNEPPVPRIPVVDSGTMTEPWQPEQPMSASFSPKSNLYGTPGKVAPSSEVHGPTRGLPLTPQSEAIKTPAASDRAFDSPSTAKSTPPRTVWDQPLSMFSSIIPTFGPTSNTTPLSTKSAASQDRIKDDTAHSQRSSMVSSVSADEVAGGTPELQRRIMEQPDSQINMPDLSLSRIVGVATEPSQPPQLLAEEDHDSFMAMQFPSVPQPKRKAPSIPTTTAVGSPSLQRMPSGDIHGVTPERSSLEPTEPSSVRLNQGATGRILGSIFGPGQSRVDTHVAEDDTSGSPAISLPAAKDGYGRVLRELPPNTSQRGPPNIRGSFEQLKPTVIDTTDHSAQTTLSADQTERLLKQKEASDAAKPMITTTFKPLSAIGAASPPPTTLKFPDPPGSPRNRMADNVGKEAAPLSKGVKRPSSATNMRLNSTAENHPPLPPDHQKAIAAAAQRTSSTEPPNVMGPPLAPASAYRANSMRPRTPSRPRTPTDRLPVVTPTSRTSTTPRARYSTMRSRASRRSSVSSFESELDERFNIRLDGMPMPDGVDNVTDPRMIQAITQTMIGEFLWKYTRKAGRGEMSNNRHRRFFWVHPYTRTLYWSDHDPSTAGRAQMKAKSVAIEAVRVVTDDNPMPPGLHRKSLVIVTPGRSVKFTAQTSQRHETWFNALSYLLLRTGPEGSDNPNLTAEELAEFNPAYNNRSSSRTRGSRISLASFRSRGKTLEPPPSGGRSQSRQSTRQPTGVPPASSLQYESDTVTQQKPQSEKRSRRNSSNLGSRISAYWKPNRGMSISSRTSQQSAGAGSATRREAPAAVGGVYRPTSSQAGSRQGSETDISIRAEGGAKEKKGLENVRSCCDGKHDVGSLHHRGGGGGGGGVGRYGSREHVGPSSHSVRSSRSNILSGGE
ncbi:MAG: hypothetical protein Q9219_002399 [cf. Caloplaca sp. 3 TL-2023]